MANFAKKSVNEIFVIRAFACLSVVFLHAISSSFKIADLVSADMEALWRSTMMMLLYGTPTFILISEFLLAHSYPERLPDGFFRKRVKYILLPYIAMAIIYNLFQIWYNGYELEASAFMLNSLKTIFLGQYHGYFILIIFQFYLLHPLFQKYIYRNFKMRWVIILSFLISFSYQACFNAFKIPYEQVYSGILFPGWLVYFTTGFYAGKNYQLLKETIGRYVKVLVPLFILSFAVLLITYFIIHFERINSRRADIIPYTLIAASLMFYAASHIRKIPLLVVEISSCSLGIYLIHPFVLRLVERYLAPYMLLGEYAIIYVVFAFLLALSASMVTVYLLNMIKIGPYIVGRVNRTVLPDKGTDSTVTRTKVGLELSETRV